MTPACRRISLSAAPVALTSLALAFTAMAPTPAIAKQGDLVFDGSAWVGRSVVPPDVIDSTPDQDRIQTDLGTSMRLSYDSGPVILRALAGADVFPVESDYNRYRLGAEAQYDLALADKGRVKLRLIPGFDYVFSNNGRVFDRYRIDGQLIMRHNREHTTTVRLRYGFRNQCECTFRGYDQSEWLGELRHFWRPGNGPTRIQGSLLGMHHDADAQRFSYDGFGAQLIGRTALTPKLDLYGRAYFAKRYYKAAFSNLYDFKRRDTQVRGTVGLEYAVARTYSLYAEGGYTNTDSNVPTRAYHGFIGQLGVRWNFLLAQGS